MHLPSSSAAPDTSEVILEVAGRIFAARGYHATTVREITREAGVNVAAVNYHFGDKHELYVHVLKKAHQAGARTAAADIAGSPRERLRAFIGGFLDYLLDPQRPAWQGQLIAREMIEPTPALDRLVKDSILPVKKRIHSIVLSLLGPSTPEARVRMACFSILGQCLFYVHSREMIQRLFPGEKHIHHNVDALTKHIFEFSLAGLQAQKRAHGRAPQTSRFPLERRRAL